MIFSQCSIVFGLTLIAHKAYAAMEVRKELMQETLPLYDIRVKLAATFLSILQTRGIRS
jgi:hypothetical protein